MAGVIKELGVEDRPYYTAKDIQEMMGVRKSKAYSIIDSIRKDLMKTGKLHSSYPHGKVPKAYFNEVFMI